MPAWLLCCIWLLIIALFLLLFVWIFFSNTHYTSKILHPGEVYHMQNRTYTFPNVECHGTPYQLRDSFIANLRKLLFQTSGLLNRLSIPWWLTGGSLIGAVKFAAIPMPFDDDVDMGVDDDKYRTFLFSSDFVKKANEDGLEVLYFQKASSKWAERTGACVRLQLPQCPCTLDIFFWKQINDKVIKLDGWSGESNVVHNAKEQFDRNDVYPLKTDVQVDDMRVNLVHHPSNVLIQQYGNQVMKQVIARSNYVSHMFVYTILKKIWVKNKAPG
jgi:phosphorylcholine metabolism protein LicD